MSLQSPSEGGGGEKEGGEVFKQEGQTDEVKEDETDASTCPEKNESHVDQPETSVAPREEDEEKEEREGGGSSSERKEEEEAAQEKNTEKQEVLTEGAKNSDSKEEEKTEVIQKEI